MDRRRLPPYARNSLNALRQAVAASDDEYDGVSKREARTVLANEERLSTAGVDDVLELFQNRGEIYYVDEEIRITEMDLSDSDA
jgi:tellurite resistance protein